jgi:small subunit ribosomal protein S9
VTDSTEAKDQGINVADTANTGTESTEVEETFESDEKGLAYTS